jgi:hypothetical protein
MKRLIFVLLILANLAAATVLHADCYVPDPANPGAWKWQPSCGSTPISYGQSVVTAGKVFTVQSTLTLLGNDGASLNIGAGGTLGALSYLSVAPIANGGTGQTTQQAALNALAGGVSSGYYLRGNGANVVLSLLQVADIMAALGSATYDTYGAASTVQGNLNSHASASTGVHGAGAYTLLNSGNIGSIVQGYNANTAVGPGSSTAGHVAMFSGTDGKNLADGGAPGVAPVSSTKTGNYTVQNSDFPGSLTMNCSTTCTLTLPAVGSIGSRGILKVTNISSAVVTLALPASTYLWGTASGFGLNSVALSGNPDIWTDGTNWYASPIDIPASPSVLVSGGTAGTWTAIGSSSTIPIPAKRAWGYMAVNASSTGCAVAPTSASTGFVNMYSGAASLYSPWYMLILTPSTLYYEITVGSGGCTITLTGYGF